MNCDACANAIKNLVEKEPGVRIASVSFSDGNARVLYDPQAVAEPSWRRSKGPVFGRISTRTREIVFGGPSGLGLKSSAGNS
jgi:cation transport ATPase